MILSHRSKAMLLFIAIIPASVFLITVQLDKYHAFAITSRTQSAGQVSYACSGTCPMSPDAKDQGLPFVYPSASFRGVVATNQSTFGYYSLPQYLRIGLLKPYLPATATSKGFFENFRGPGYTLSEGQISPNGRWEAIYAQGGPGAVMVKKDSQIGSNAMFFYPEASFGRTIPPPAGREPDLHSCLVISTPKYKDFDLTLNVKTVKQLRTPTPNGWENAWVMWNRPEPADDYHYYAFTLFTNGAGQLEKKDNNVHDDSKEIYLAYGHYPLIYNTWQTWRIRVTDTATGTPNIQVSINGIHVLNYTDNNPSIKRNSSTMLNGGSIVLYCEDSIVAFANIRINPL